MLLLFAREHNHMQEIPACYDRAAATAYTEG